MGSTNESHPMSIHFSTKEMTTAIAFYTEVLGFDLQTVWPPTGEPQWASITMSGQTIMLGQATSIHEGPAKEFHEENNDSFNLAAGGGVLVYIQVDDIDAFHEEVISNGGKPACEPKNEFYGLRNFMIKDMDGYQLAFYAPLQMTSCQSCGMPLSEAKEGQMYCGHCSDDIGSLHPYEHILEGTITGYFMGMQKMERAEAEIAAKEHLAKMPAWACK
ncbi:MAG: putative glyoxalase superfamily protein PhnB [Planctomycetota bacterium]|jgi:uncharacterized glyoxalase superfamily protein PhnB